MHNPTSLALLGIALLNNATHGFSCTALPPAAWIRSTSTKKSILPTTTTTTAQMKQIHTIHPLAVARGGALSSSRRSGDNQHDLNLTVGKTLTSAWGTFGVAYILIKAIRRVLPIAVEPFKGGVALSHVELGAYILTCLWFAYVEGYKGFQLKFSPLVVARSFTLTPSSHIHHLLLAPLYSMGLFHATKKRMIVSWSVSIGVAAIVAAVKRLPYPWRNIVDAGVVIGLSWGTISMLGGYIISLVTGIAPIDVDPALPEKE